MFKRAKPPALSAFWNQPSQLSAENIAAEEPSCSRSAPAEERERDVYIDHEEAVSSSTVRSDLLN